MTEVGFGNDGDFSDRAMILKVNNNLANELGNLCQRVLSMVYKNCNKAVPDVSITTTNTERDIMLMTEDDKALLDSAKSLHDKAATAISKQAIQTYANHLIEIIWDANRYIDDMAPWALKKSGGDDDIKRMETILYVLMEVLRYVSILYQPIIPDSAGKILDQLGIPESERSFHHLQDRYKIKPLSPISKPKGVFPRIDTPGSNAE